MLRKARIMMWASKILFRLKPLKRTSERSFRKVKTSQGVVKVIEYGFQDKTPAPLYVDMHGGGFVLMIAQVDDDMNLYFREKTGVKIISIDYPKAPDFPYPAAVEAVHEVVQYYFNHAEAFGIDSTRIGIGGHSAGANLATVECMIAKERSDMTYIFQMLDYPPLDLDVSAYAKPQPEKCIPPEQATIFDTSYAKPEQRAHPHVSPVYATQEQLIGLPPALLIVAGFDSLHDEGVKYATLLEQAGVSVEKVEFENMAHGFTYNKGEDTVRALAIIADFINRHIVNESIS